jgi:hypothetical protein
MVDTPGHADFGGEVCGPHIIFYDLDRNVDFDVQYDHCQICCRLNELLEWWKELSWLLMLERDL